LPYDPELLAFIRQIPGRSWHADLKKWTIPYTEEAVHSLSRLFKGVQIIVSSELQKESSLLMVLHSRSGPNLREKVEDGQVKQTGYAQKQQVTEQEFIKQMVESST
jgi:hypothetical protein